MTEKRETAKQKKERLVAEAAEAARLEAEKENLNDLLNEEGNEEQEENNNEETSEQHEEQHEEEKKPMAKKILDLGTLTELNNEYDGLSKHEKLKTVGGEASVEIADKLNTLGIRGIFSKGTTTNDMGFYHIGYKIPELPNNEGGMMEYGEAYNTLVNTWRKNPLFRKRIEGESQGELITIAAVGGLFLQFIKPYGEAITLEGMDGNDLVITSEDWHKNPVGIWKNGGRATKVGHLLGLTNFLNADYDRKPTDKFQSQKFQSKYWITVDMVGDTIRAWKKGSTNTKVTMPENIGTGNGWKDFIDWAQTATV